MQNYTQLLRLFDYPGNTQLMRESVELQAIKYLRIGDLKLIYSYIEKKDKLFQNPHFAAPALVHQIVQRGSEAEITIKTLRDEYDQMAIQLVRTMPADQIEGAYSHIRPEYLSPRIRKDEWDDWTFSYRLGEEQKQEKRRAQTERKVTAILNCFESGYFEGKRILFFGCGDGSEVDAFIKHSSLKEADIWGIDLNEKGLDQCEQLKKVHAGIKLHFRMMDFENLSELSGESFDYIFALGIFDRETLSFGQGKMLLPDIKQKLRFDKLIIANYSFDLFSAENYRDLGYDIVRTCDPFSLYTHNTALFYELEPSDRAASEITDMVALESVAFWT